MISSVVMSYPVNFFIIDPHQNLSAELEQKLVENNPLAEVVRVTDSDVIAHFEGNISNGVLVNIPRTRSTISGTELTTEDKTEFAKIAELAARIGFKSVINLVPMPRVKLRSPQTLNFELPTDKAKAAGIAIHHIVLPTVIDAKISDQFGFLGGIYNACRTIVTTETLALALANAARKSESKVTYLAENKDDNPYYAAGSRALDVVASLAGLIALGWLMVLAFAAVRLETKGAAVFRQKRIGLNGQLFTCLKMRTMYVGTPQVDSHSVGASAITPVGSFLRKSKIDELPQLLNILKGDLSLVGPRPCIQSLEGVIARRRAANVFDVKPGLTGLAQVRQQDTSIPDEMVSSEVLYMVGRNLILDVKIILATAMGRGFGDKAVNSGAQSLAVN